MRWAIGEQACEGWSGRERGGQAPSVSEQGEEGQAQGPEGYGGSEVVRSWETSKGLRQGENQRGLPFLEAEGQCSGEGPHPTLRKGDPCT